MSDNKSNKWQKAEESEGYKSQGAGSQARKAQAMSGSGAGYRPQYTKRQAPRRYSPKKSIKSFRDLDVYQRTMECAVLIQNDITPILEKDEFRFIENMTNCMLGIPLLIAEAHGQRFSDFNKAVATLESAMQGCNKMVVYLDQGVATSPNLEESLADDAIRRYMEVRGKMLRLLRSWQKFRNMAN